MYIRPYHGPADPKQLLSPAIGHNLGSLLRSPFPTVRHLLIIAFLLAAIPLLAQPPVASFTENKGQWPDQVAYRARVPGGLMFVERSALTYSLHSGGPLANHGHAHDEPVAEEHAHAFRVSFDGASQAVPEGAFGQSHYENYFLGNDPEKWGTGCAVYGMVSMRGLYPGIDLRVDGREGLKYEFLVAAGADPAQVQLHFEGQDDLILQDGRLIVTTTAGTVTEQAPVAFQETAAGRKHVPCAFGLVGDRVFFDLPDGYDPSLPLVIDPVLTFGSYSGSTADNFGFTATYDAAGHLYGGGIVFGAGYPASVGVLDPSFNGGTIDIGLTKFAPDGSSLIWSTYIGGSGNETPQSLVVNTNNELYLFGSSGSANFPTTGGAYDPVFNGGTPISGSAPVGWVGMTGGYGYGHTNGTDIVVAHFSADATALIGSTYVGGSGNDGVNNVLPLSHNYGDHFRGEIALDLQEWPVISTSTQSTDIPVSANAPQTTFGGGTQDAYLFRMNPALSTLQATFYGGSGADSGYGVQFDSNGQVFTTGGTTSTNLAMPGSPMQGLNSGGADGYVARWSADLGQLLSATYAGTSTFDQSYFVQLDLDDEVYIVGQTHGAYPVSSGVYSNPGSTQFIQKFNHDLSNSLWSTLIGSGLGNENISPSAFLVSDCGQIYFSGWGGLVNHNAQATGSTTTGLPTTIDAFQATTTGSDFYLMVLEENATALNYATFFGGALSAEHVDGGTSRFDKHGTVYQAVCAGCPGNDDFPTTPGAWAPSNGSFNCNLGVFKFDLLQPTAEIGVDGPDYACLPGATVSFINLSVGGSIFDWDFGDGTDTTAFEPDHTYTTAGSYTVRLVLSDEDVCTSNDTAYVTVTILALSPPSIDPVPPICPGGSVQLQAHGGHAFEWLPAVGITDLLVADPVVQPLGNTTYTVLVTDSCGTDTASVEVIVVSPADIMIGNDTTVCVGNSVPLTASGGGTYSWVPAAALDDPTSATPLASPLDTTLYHVLVTTPEGCLMEDSMWVFTQTDLPVPVVSDTVICRGDQVQLHAVGGDSYEWQPAAGISELGVPDPLVGPSVSTNYTVLVSNTCGTVSASAFVGVQYVNASAWPDTLVCPNDPLVLHAAGGTVYEWSPQPSATDSLVLSPAVAGIYSVIVEDDLGCWDSASVSVSLYPPASVTAGYETSIDFNESAQLFASGTGTYLWSPDSTLSCGTCPDPVASPETTTTYTVEVTDNNGCKAIDQVTIHFRGSLFVPNTFTPNGDGVNDLFHALTREVAVYRLMVFNRWGELIFDTDRLEGAWDGTYKGQDSPIDTYVWRVDYTEVNGRARTVYGHVNLLR